MTTFDEAYKSVSKSLSALHFNQDVFNDIASYNNEVEEILQKCISNIRESSLSGKAEGTLKGYAAEFWHAGTLKASSISIDGKNIVDSVVKGTTSINSPDIVVSDAVNSFSVQTKYWATPNETLKELLNHDYYYMQKIVPAEQLNPIKKLILNRLEDQKIATDQKLKLNNILNTIDNRIKFDKYMSKHLSNADAQMLVDDMKSGKFDPKNYNLLVKNFVNKWDVIKLSGKAALNTALLYALINIIPHLLIFVKEIITEGELNLNNLLESGKSGLRGAGTGALIGGVSAGIMSSCKLGLLGESLKKINPNVVSVSVIVAVNAMLRSIELRNGKISKEQFGEMCIRDALIVSISFAGMGFGQALIPVPVLGAIIGGVIGSIIGTIICEGSKKILLSFFIENGIAIPFLVKQDYTMPIEVLKQSGFDIMEPNVMKPDLMKPNIMVPDQMEPDSMDVISLKRGVIGVNTIGYI